MEINLINKQDIQPRKLGFTRGHFAIIALSLAVMVAFTIVTRSAGAPRFAQQPLPEQTLTNDQAYQQVSTGAVAGSSTFLPRGPAAQ